MTEYLLSVYITEGDALPPEEIEKLYAAVDVFNEEVKAAGAWVFAGGLHPQSTATVLRPKDGEVLLTDGPYVEAKEHLGGCWIIKADDLDAALAWGRKAALACASPVEVRPFQDDPEG